MPEATSNSTQSPAPVQQPQLPQQTPQISPSRVQQPAVMLTTPSVPANPEEEPSTLLQWLYTQFRPSSIAKTVVIFGIFGFIPGAWFFGLPVLLGYGLIKKSHIKKAVEKLKTEYIIFNDNFWEELGKKIADGFSDDPISVAKAFATFLMLSSGLSLWTLVGIYGIYRFTNQEWATSFSEKLESAYTLIVNTITRAQQRGVLDAPALLLCMTSFLAAWSIYTAGLLSLSTLGIGLLVLWTGAILVGLSAVFRDLVYVAYNPIKTFTENSGKILGFLSFRYLAHKLFSGTIQGTLGHAQGFVMSSEASLFLIPENKLTFGISGLGILFDKIRSAINGFLSTYFLTAQVDTTGSFSGVVGPSPGILFMASVVGILMGLAVEKLVDALYQAAEDDTIAVKNKTIQAVTTVDHLYNAKWHLAYIAMITPSLLYSSWGAPIIAIANGSLLGAAAIISGSLAGAFMTLYTFSYAVEQTVAWLKSTPVEATPPVTVASITPTAQNQSPTTPQPATPTSATTAPQPALTPAFNQQKEHAKSPAPVDSSITNNKSMKPTV